MNSSKKTIYRVHFKTEDRNYSLLARSVKESEFFGFIEVSEIIFEDTNRLIISPEDEALRKEFAKTESVSIPHQYLRRIDRLSDSDDIGVSYLKIAESKKKND
ncbi:MAG: hypothetical protein DRH03_08990 [Deltaproteobacteria bacterium]|nr:MAG: hypothetical protein DRH03_08990 [Deltaproteobacteria bacterium]